MINVCYKKCRTIDKILKNFMVNYHVNAEYKENVRPNNLRKQYISQHPLVSRKGLIKLTRTESYNVFMQCIVLC